MSILIFADFSVCLSASMIFSNLLCQSSPLIDTLYATLPELCMRLFRTLTTQTILTTSIHSATRNIRHILPSHRTTNIPYDMPWLINFVHPPCHAHHTTCHTVPNHTMPAPYIHYPRGSTKRGHNTNHAARRDHLSMIDSRYHTAVPTRQLQT